MVTLEFIFLAKEARYSFPQVICLQSGNIFSIFFSSFKKDIFLLTSETSFTHIASSKS